MRSYSVCKLIPPTMLNVRIVPKCRTTVYMLDIIVGCLSSAFRKIIRLEKSCMNVFPDFSWVQDPRRIIIIFPLSLLLSCPALVVLVLVRMVLVLGLSSLLSPPLPVPLLAHCCCGDGERPVNTHSTLQARTRSSGRWVLGCGLILVISALAF